MNGQANINRRETDEASLDIATRKRKNKDALLLTVFIFFLALLGLFIIYSMSYIYNFL